MKFNFKNTCLLGESDIKNTSLTLYPYVRHLNDVKKSGSYDAPEASLNLPYDKNFTKEALDLAKKKESKKIKYVLVVGIGGSNLGTMAIYDALFGTLNVALDSSYPKLLFLDTNNPENFLDIKDIISKTEDADEVLINIISKSGGTTETIANFEAIYEFLNEKFGGEVKQRVVVTTDDGSNLFNSAKEKGISILTIPKNVGGRYSVFSLVGLFPLALCGLNIEKIISGAKEMADRCLIDDENENPALASAVMTFLHQKKGVNISNSFFFHSQLETIGRWYRQLMGESIGKQYDTEGKEVRVGITPIISVGSTDLHSMAQLFLGGPRDKFTTFINTKPDDSDVKVPKDLSLGELVKGIRGRDFSEIMDAIYKGVKEAYAQNQMPYCEVLLDDISERSIGQFLQFKMIEMMFLAQLLNVNAFDQPNVEDYKKVTKKLLES